MEKLKMNRRLPNKNAELNQLNGNRAIDFTLFGHNGQGKFVKIKRNGLVRIIREMCIVVVLFHS